MASVDVVVVSYNSREQLRDSVAELAAESDFNVVVVDNASSDGSLEAVADLDVEAVAMEENGGFARGSNVGFARGSAPYVLLLNPDARIHPAALRALVAVLDATPAAGAVAPKILHSDGSLDFSQRRFPRLRSTYAQALFLHRVFPRAGWVDEVVRTRESYERPGAPDWVSGACILLRRSVLEELGGLDEGFFLYCEDTDLCLRVWQAGHEVRYEPSAVVVHEGGASAPRPALLPVLAASRLRYAAKHDGRATRTLERIGIGAGELTHVVVSKGGRPARRGHLEALRLVISPARSRSYGRYS